jgi:nicotinic acid mononucleotide adenylyltransferase
MTDNLPVPDDAPWLNLSQNEIQELRKQKHEITEYAKEKLRKLIEKQEAQND